jgi:hypothetical protein
VVQFENLSLERLKAATDFETFTGAANAARFSKRFNQSQNRPGFVDRDSISRVAVGWRPRRSFLRALTDFGGQAGAFAGDGAARRQGVGLHLHGGTPFDGADYRSIVHAIGVGHGDEPLLGAHAIDHALLPGAEHGMRKNWEVTEHPQKIDALKK